MVVGGGKIIIPFQFSFLAARAKFGDAYAVNNGLSYVYSAKGGYAKALEYANKALAQAPGGRAKTMVAANIEKLKGGKDINTYDKIKKVLSGLWTKPKSP